MKELFSSAVVASFTLALVAVAGCETSTEAPGTTGIDVTTDTGADSGLDALADAAAPDTCVKNKNFCWNNAIWGCSAAGVPVGEKESCASGKVCVVEGGVAVCAKPPEDAISGTDVAAETDTASTTDALAETDAAGTTDANAETDVAATTDAAVATDAEAGTDTLTATDVAESDAPVLDVPLLDVPGGTDAVADVEAATDAAAGGDASGPTSCAANKNFCFEGDVWGCNGSGKPTGLKTACTGGKSCAIASGVASCQTPTADASVGDDADASSGDVADTASGPTSCTANKNFCHEGEVWGCDGSGKPTTVKKTCTGEEVCGEQAGVMTCYVPSSDTSSSADSEVGSDASADVVVKSCTANKNFCEGKDIWSCTGAGKPGIVTKTCGDGEVCGIDGGAAVCIPGEYSCEGDTCTCTPTQPDVCVKVVKSGTTTGYVYAVQSRDTCYENTTLSECAEYNSCVDGQCASSVLDPLSQYWYKSCDLSQYLTYKTALEADCRCLVNQAVESGVDPCKRPQELWNAAKTFGTGPHPAALDNITWEGGFIEPATNQLYVAISWGSSSARKGAIFQINVITGARAVISGDYTDNGSPQSAGSGPALAWPTDLAEGVTGTVYSLNNVATAAPQIIAVDLTTGARTLVWEGGNGNFGQCPSGEGGGKVIQYTTTGFLRDSDGSFLLGYANPIADGRGIVRISADGSACTSVTGSGSPGGSIDKGSGSALGGFVQGFAAYNGKIWATTTQPKALWSIDPATGDRTVAFTVNSAGDLGERRLMWDATRGLMWTSGLQNSVTVVAWDPLQNLLYDAFVSCGDGLPFTLCWSGPIKINSLNYGGMYLHPTTGQLFFGQDNAALVEVEPETGNSIVRSL